MIDKFLPMVLDAEEEGSQSPILIHEKVTFVYIKHQNLYRILGCGERGMGEGVERGWGEEGRGGAHFYLHSLGVEREVVGGRAEGGGARGREERWYGEGGSGRGEGERGSKEGPPSHTIVLFDHTVYMYMYLYEQCGRELLPWEVCKVQCFSSLNVSSLTHLFSVVATTIKNANVALIFSFLHRIVEVSFARASLQGRWIELQLIWK